MKKQYGREPRTGGRGSEWREGDKKKVWIKQEKNDKKWEAETERLRKERKREE